MNENAVYSEVNKLKLYGSKYKLEGNYQWVPCRLNPHSGEIIQVRGPPNQRMDGFGERLEKINCLKKDLKGTRQEYVATRNFRMV